MALLFLFTGYLMILSLVGSIQTADVSRDFALSSAQLASAREQIEMQTESNRHDFHHFVSVLGRLSDEGRYAELRRFLSEYAKKSDPEPLPVFCENVVANSILGFYSLRFKEQVIPFHCTCQIPKELSVSDSDLCVVLGNALENAMEACAKLEATEIRFVSAEGRAMNGQLLIKISNPYDGTLNQTDGNYLTAKEGLYHGMGLKNICKVVEAYGGFVKTEHSKTVFTLMVAFPEPVSNRGSN